MIIIKLQGGLGNQLFQYAFGRSLSIESGRPLLLDTTALGESAQQTGDTPRSYRLDAFSIKASVASTKELQPFNKISRSRILRKCMRISQYLGLAIFPRYVTEDGYNLVQKLPEKSVYLSGYWHNGEYFLKHREILLKELSLTSPLSSPAQTTLEHVRASACPVSIHIRRGDYVSHKVYSTYYRVLPIEYYTEAIELIEQKSSIAPVFFIFSDDIEWAKTHIKTNSPVVFVSNPHIKDYEELILMSQCTHHIIANSSFSWWGAWLNPKENKIVVAPKKWFVTQPQPSNLLPTSWIQI